MTVDNSQVAPPAGSQFGGFIRIDVDGDGADDQVVRVLSHAPPQPATFQFMGLLQNNGGGHFRYAGPCAPNGLQFGGPFAYSIDHYLAADCDGDGDQDVIANSNPANGDGYSSQIFWNTNGMFGAGPNFDFFSGGRIDRVADFDGDGRPDLLMTGNLNGLHVRRGTGNGAFAITWSATALPFEPAAVTVADVDDDGRLDFVAPNAAGTPVLFVNTGAVGGPAFAAFPLTGVTIVISPSNVASSLRATIAAGDFDGDGRTDLALGRIPGEPNIGILLRRLTWSPVPTLANYALERQTFVDGFAVDADLDGDTDLVGAFTTRSNRFAGTAAGNRLQFFAGTPGEGGAAPVLGATGPFRVGSTEVLRLTGVPGPTLALLGLSLGTTTLPGVPLPGLTLRLDPASLIVADWPIVQNGQGRAAAMTTMPILLMNGLQGYTFYLQAFVFDPAAPQLFTQSNLLQKNVGL
jgi:hypothetical protein